MIAAIVLAAGHARRMGAPKVLLPFAGTTVINHIVTQLRAAPLADIVIVTGPRHRDIAAALAGHPVRLVPNPDPDGDMLSSVRTGLRALQPDCRAALIALGDQPRITTELVRQLLRAFETGNAGLLVPTFHGRRGHPLLMTTAYRDEVLRQHDAEGLRGLLHAHPDDLATLPVEDNAVLADMDTPEDYHRECAAQARRDGRGECGGGPPSLS